MKKYEKILNDILDSKEIFEQALNSEKIEKIERLKSANDIKNILNMFNNDIGIIKSELMNISFDEIKIDKDDGIYIVKYNNKIHALLLAFKANLFNMSDNQEIANKIFVDGYRDLFLELEIHEENLNKIDILNGLPNFMRNIGLGKKIYKKLTKDFNYISSFYGYEPSIDSDMVWSSIGKDKDIFTFINDNNIISFWNDFDYNEIIEKLKDFYNIKGEIFFDDDFLKKYNLTDTELTDMIKKTELLQKKIKKKR